MSKVKKGNGKVGALLLSAALALAVIVPQTAVAADLGVDAQGEDSWKIMGGGSAI